MENVSRRGACQSVDVGRLLWWTCAPTFDVEGAGRVAEDVGIGGAAGEGGGAQPRSTPISRSSESRSSASSPFLMKSYAPASVAAFFASSCAE